MSKTDIKEIQKTIEGLEKDLNKLKKLLGSYEPTPEHEELPGEEGIFDGVNMIMESGEKIKVPENYAAKSRIVYGDMLKKVIVNGKDRFKQIDKVSRKEVEGIITRKEGIWHVLTEYGSHAISSNAAEYNDVKVNDQVIVILPEKNPTAPFAALDKVVTKKQEDKKDDKKEKDNSKSKSTQKTQKKSKKKEDKKEQPSKKPEPKPEPKSEPKSEPEKEEKQSVTTLDDSDLR